jgi:UDP-glucuronate 4-epimerase
MKTNKTILVTGAAGFIGFHLAKALIKQGYTVVGLDNINAYYDVNLKYARLNELGIDRAEAEVFNELCISASHGLQMQFIRMNLEDRTALPKLFKELKFDMVCNLAAQPGVRYSLENPEGLYRFQHQWVFKYFRVLSTPQCETTGLCIQFEYLWKQRYGPIS